MIFSSVSNSFKLAIHLLANSFIFLILLITSSEGVALCGDSTANFASLSNFALVPSPGLKLVLPSFCCCFFHCATNSSYFTFTFGSNTSFLAGTDAVGAVGAGAVVAGAVGAGAVGAVVTFLSLFFITSSALFLASLLIPPGNPSKINSLYPINLKLS